MAPIGPTGEALPYPDQMMGPDLAGLGMPAAPQGNPGIDDPRYEALVMELQRIAEGEPDVQDRAQLTKLVADLLKLIANRTAETDKMLGSPALARMLRR